MGIFEKIQVMTMTMTKFILKIKIVNNTHDNQSFKGGGAIIIFF